MFANCKICVLVREYSATWRSLSLLILLSVGCAPESVSLEMWRLLAPESQHHLSPRLCEFRGKRLAIVAGPAFGIREGTQSHSLLLTDRYSGKVIRQRARELRYSIDGRAWEVLNAETEPPVDAMGRWSGVMAWMGFDVLDRSHVSMILDEHDFQVVLARDAGRVGDVLGADVLAVLSHLVKYDLYYVSFRKGYSLAPDPRIQAQVTFISVADGANLGSIYEAGSGFSYSGFDRVEARDEPTAGGWMTNWYLHGPSGKRVSVEDIDYVARTRETANRWGFAEYWRSLCVSASGQEPG